MGVDFIRTQSGKPHSKRWAQGIDRLKQADLFEVNFAPECRFITAESECMSLSPGDEVLIQADGNGRCAAFSGLSRVATIESVPAPILAALEKGHGIIPAIIDRVGCVGRTIELRLP